MFITFNATFAENFENPIRLLISPIKYEIEGIKGSTITKTAMLLNRTNKTYRIITGKSAFMASGETGKPQFVYNQPLIPLDQQLPNWITINTDNFIIGPYEKRYITFTIDIPSNATPGGHYGAIFFKNNDFSALDSDTSIGIKMDYGLLILINVDGEVITKGELEDIIINTENNITKIDNCPYLDFTKSNYDGKCIDDIITLVLNKINGVESQELIKEQELVNKEDSGLYTSANEFNISFEIPFRNTGNTHLKPEGKIKLIDDKGKELKGIGKKVIKNDDDIMIGEEIVDYLPINDVGGNVLPDSLRRFISKWLGFPYKSYDEKGNPIIEYWSPSDYYTKKNMKENGFIMFWEKVIERQNRKKITAIVDFSYKDRKGFDVEFNPRYEFYINYKEKYIGLNYYLIIPAILLFLLIIIIKIIKGFRKKRCSECSEVISKKMKLCPYCGNNLKIKEKKKK